MNKYEFIRYCREKDYEYNVGQSFCICNDFGGFVNVKIKDKWHTFYCLDNGGFRFDKTLVKSIKDIEDILDA